jgi:Protein of unknown function (DUF3099)
VVHSITSAHQAHSDDLNLRIRRYLFSMGLRTLCVVLVVVIHHPVRWVFAVLAVILPYIAVVMANAVGSRRGAGPAPVTVTHRALPVTIDLADYTSGSDSRSDASPERPN